MPYPIPPHPSCLSVDKSSVCKPTGLEKLLTVDCLFGFVNVSALEKGWTEESQGSWRTLVLCFLSFWLTVHKQAVILCTYELTCNPMTSDSLCV